MKEIPLKIDTQKMENKEFDLNFIFEIPLKNMLHFWIFSSLKFNFS